MKRISFEALISKKRDLSYQEQYDYIMELLASGRIKPLLASGKNGKKPSLYREYWLLEEKKEKVSWEEELKYTLVPAISIDYYLAHPEVYHKERPWVLKLNAYLRDKRELLIYPESVNERSFEIWQREKFLSREQGKTILKHCKLAAADLHMYDTTEPLACYSHTREVPQNLLLLENKDTFYSMRRHLLEGNDQILGISVGTLIYGAGKGILRSFQDFGMCTEPYMADERNTVYYFGDLDYEGIGIYENLAERWNGCCRLMPFVRAYEKMLKKAENMEELPDTKEQQNRKISGTFFDWFEEASTGRMRKILENGKYIPQEILNITDF